MQNQAENNPQKQLHDQVINISFIFSENLISGLYRLIHSTVGKPEKAPAREALINIPSEPLTPHNLIHLFSLHL